MLWLSMALQVTGRSFVIGCQARTDTRTRTGTVPKPIVHNPNVSLSLNIPGHAFYVNSWLSRSEGGPFSLAAREKLILVLGFWSERGTFSLADRKELAPVPEL